MTETPAPHRLGIAPATEAVAVVQDLFAGLADPVLTSMTLLNEIVGRYPGAVSFAAGRPFEGFYEVAAAHRYLDRFCGYLRDDLGWSEEQVCRTLFQYHRTKGTIHELVVRQLAQDEGLTVDPEAVVVTTGCQEAMILVLRALRAGPKDVIFTSVPTYVGFLGAARLVEVQLRPIPEHPGGMDLDALRRDIRKARAEGLRPRACYVVPDFANPSGTNMSSAARRELVELAEREDILLLEDNPYGILAERRIPTLKSIDPGGRVVYFGTFAKSVFAGARVGYVVADQRTGDGGLFADELAKIKSMLTLNTSSVAQAVIGGFLLEHGCSLRTAVRREAELYRRNQRRLLAALDRHFPRAGPLADVTWNVPAGGMFLVLTLPFAADEALLARSAAEFGVLWTPMYHFYGGCGGARQLRLSFSVVTADEIDTGIERLAALVADELGRTCVAAA
ncbi:MAG TPA: PLP-dependent aminotransferase family protein [Pseudonocardiaceae bacterium]|nr:PLP-dependent aminotransferase family protein [Pseudonocardiaceae bacterium]